MSGRGIAGIAAACLALTAGVFVLDLVTPLGLAVWLLYCVPVLLAAATRRKAWLFAVAALCSALIVAGLFLSPPGATFAFAAVNRLLGIVLVWAIALAASTLLFGEAESGPSGVGQGRLTVASFVSVAAIMAVLVGMTYRISESHHETERFVAHTHEILTELALVLSSMTDVETGQRGFLLTGKESYLEPYARTLTETHQHLNRLKALTRDNQTQQDRLPLLEAAVAEKQVELEQTVSARRTRGPEAALRIVESGRGKAVMDALRRTIADMEQTERDLLARRVEEAALLFQSQILLLIMGGFLMAGLLATVTLLLRRAQTAQQEQSRFFTVSQDLLCQAGADGYFKRVNQAWTRTLGYSAEELLAEPFQHFIHPDDREATLQAVRKEATGESIAAFENRYRCKDGSYKWLSWTASPVLDQGLIYAAARDITEHKRAEETIRQILATLDATTDGIFVFDPQTLRFSHVNEGAMQQVGYSREELLRMTPLDIKPAFDEPRFRAMLAPLASGQQGAHNFTTAHRRKDGVDVPVEVNLQCVGAGTPQARMIAIVRDITERKRAEEALHKATEEIRDLYENAPCGYHSLDKDGTFVNINNTELKWLGFAREEVVRKMKVSDLLTPDSLERFRINFPLFKERGWVRDLELDLIRKDGTILPILLNADAVRDAAGNFAMSHSTLFDITERKKAEEARRRLAAIVESSEDAIIGQTMDGIVTSWNRGAERLYGYTAGEITGHPITILLPPDRADEEAQIIARLAQGERMEHFETVRQAKDGRLIDVSLTISPIEDERGTIVGISKIAHDITERKQAEAAIRRQSALLEAANKELEAFTYSVSHDLRAPLRSLDGFSQAVLEDYAEKLDAQGQDYLRRIRTAAQRMGLLIDDFLKLSRLTRTELKREPVDVTELARSVFAELAAREPDRQVAWAVQEGLSAVGDRRLLRVVLENLLGNAWKFTGRQPSPRIEVEAAEEAAPDGSVRYVVRDNGAGFDMAHADKLFQPFQRLHGMGEFPGTGIGLAIVERVIRLHGGQVGAEGAVGQGASVWFTLPH